MNTATKALAAGSAIAAVAVMAGSWAPFEFRTADLAKVIESYLGAGVGGRSSRSDVVANTALGVPFAFLFQGFLHSLGGSYAWRMFATLLALIMSAALSVACELPQGWLDGRVPSLRDTTAQMAGAAIGCIAWWVLGPSCLAAMDRLVNAPRTAHRAQAVVTLAAIASLMWSILPGQILVSPVDYARKWTRGEIEPVPFMQPVGPIGDAISQWGWTICIGIVMGLWAHQLTQPRSEARLTPAGRWLLVLALGLLPELLQIPIAKRFASATDAIFSILGAVIGFLAAHRVWSGPVSNAQAQSMRLYRDPAFWFGLSTLYLLLLCAFAWAPFQFVTQSSEVRARLQGLIASPFSDNRGSNLRLFFNIVRMAALAAGWGVMAGVGAGLANPRWLRNLAIVMLGVAAVVISLGIELGQLLEPSHTGGGLGFCTRLVGMGIGAAVGVLIVRGASGERPP